MSEMYKRIEGLCNSNGISITQMCKEACVSRGSLTDLKKGRSSELSSSSLSKIAEFFGVSTDYLLGRTEDPINYDDDILIAEIPEELLRHFDGNVKAAYKAWMSRTEPDNSNNGITEVKPKLRSLARLENDEFTEEEDKEILRFIDFLKSKRGE